MVYYKYFILFNSIIVVLAIPARVAFELKPHWYSLAFEFTLDLVFFIDMVYTIGTNQIGHKRGELKKKNKQYFSTWFVADLYGFFPLAYLRHISNYDDGGKDAWRNLATMNFDRMPRLYKVMLLPQLLRGRHLREYLNLFFENMEIAVIYKNLLWTFLSIYYILHISGCFWYV
jgi:hypothetical protein